MISCWFVCSSAEVDPSCKSIPVANYVNVTD